MYGQRIRKKSVRTYYFWKDKNDNINYSKNYCPSDLQNHCRNGVYNVGVTDPIAAMGVAHTLLTVVIIGINPR